MRNVDRLSRWDNAVTSYLAHWRALGRVYRNEESMLHSVRPSLRATGSTDLDQQVFNRWRKGLRHLHPNTRRARETAVYNFCRYRRRQEPHYFLPDPLSFTQLQPHRMPVILAPAQIARLLVTASAQRPRNNSPLYPFVLRLSVVLLYTAGLRLGELRRLRLDDVHLREGALRIRESKFHKSRWVSLSASACEELRRYLKIRRRSVYGTSPEAPLLCNGRRRLCFYSCSGLGDSIQRLFALAGVCDDVGRRPRVHDMRHSFAAAALLRWYETGADVQANLPKLALYMGHVSIVSTAYYLRCLSAVTARASERFEHSYARLIEGSWHEKP